MMGHTYSTWLDALDAAQVKGTSTFIWPPPEEYTPNKMSGALKCNVTDYTVTYLSVGVVSRCKDPPRFHLKVQTSVHCEHCLRARREQDMQMVCQVSTSVIIVQHFCDYSASTSVKLELVVRRLKWGGAMSSLKSTSLSVMRPPKPPCWRDFVAPTARSIASEGVDVTEPTGRTVGGVPRSSVVDFIDVTRSPASLPANKPSRLSRRPRARIHRTRSEHIIPADDLPESALTGTLADTDPKGLRTRMSEGCMYVEENNRRCQSWLASIEAAEPLDEVDYTSDGSPTDISKSDIVHRAEKRGSESGTCLRYNDNELIPISETDQGEEVEIPEETFVWEESQGKRPQSSSGSGEELCSTCNHVTSHAHRTHPSNSRCCVLHEKYHGGAPTRETTGPEHHLQLSRCIDKCQLVNVNCEIDAGRPPHSDLYAPSQVKSDDGELTKNFETGFIKGLGSSRNINNQEVLDVSDAPL
ncbi:hypothetical protein Btru_034591 [Bulinus truncatus]|nr:hypothetical protein Btru_034591 [Bulinus truncatus]